ncbi:beta-glucuronidase-like isoform X2 [Ruditapes philippinarum]|uniref:beta-glucuronidase-like isoform X2 n=1 Tax=Ruditapes philippinarum TaxID=129788 RepID=UPI00295C308C|nr:beta-glucuronidase-like isoform X2 [Ruditapes philippinarum]
MEFSLRLAFYASYLHVFSNVCFMSNGKPAGMLYPRDSESRSLRHLDGMWGFMIDDSPSRNESFVNKWYSDRLSQFGDVIPMPVPSSYNDITNSKLVRDFVGWAWYDREFYLDNTWSNKRIVLRIDSAHYNAIVWVNGQEAMSHEGGHLPFEAEVTNMLHLDGSNYVTVAMNNTLTPTTLPPGAIEYKTNPEKYPAGYFVQNLQMDFFNYAGLHRHVTLYSTPVTYIEDIDITTDIQGNNGIVSYVIYSGGKADLINMKVEIIDKVGHVIATKTSYKGTVTIPDANLWWPYTMNVTSPGYMYTLKVSVTDDNGGVSDIYRQPFGIRTVSVTNKSLIINDRPFYCQGVNKHEDSDIRGKGLDYALIARDFNMLKWLGVNCFRTSHYPYAEEIMDQADQQGIVVIDESPGVGISNDDNFSNKSLEHHKAVMTEMYQRDKNRPSVIMWSVANEPATNKAKAGPYFKSVIDHVRSLDSSRPVTFVCNQDYNTDVAVQYVDIILVNKYYAWYSDVGHTELIQLQLENDLRHWHAKFNKPMILSEYGADTIAGFHQVPSFVFTEEYQREFLEQYHKAFDTLSSEFLVGEMPWNFADFMTVQGITRVVGNKKGLLTRQRQPKMSAHLIRDRYMRMIHGDTCKKY